VKQIKSKIIAIIISRNSEHFLVNSGFRSVANSSFGFPGGVGGDVEITHRRRQHISTALGSTLV